MQNAPDSEIRRFDVIVFDLGGVLIELVGVARMLEWLDHLIDENALWKRWLASESVRRFECGSTEPEQFATEFLEEFQLSVGSEQFLAEFTVWPARAYPGASDLLRLLAADYKVACLSNTNALHWSRMCDQMDLIQHFNHHFASHHIGLLKPDREIFEHMVQKLGCSPDRILFLDDNQTNVDGACAAGIEAHRVVGLAGAIEKLTELGILHSDHLHDSTAPVRLHARPSSPHGQP